MKDLVSVIVPIYNVEKYLSRCIDSILNQTYKQLEIILVNDGSPDDCGHICDEYAKKDVRIKVIHQENGGISAARNRGLEVATGTYISFVDGDDWIHPTYIEVLYRNMKQYDADISVCNFVKLSSESIVASSEPIEIMTYSNYEALEQLHGKYALQFVVPWGKIYHGTLFEGVRFPVGRVHEDEFVTYKLLHKANIVVFTTEQLIYYWQRSDSIMGRGFQLKGRLDATIALKEQATYFQQIGMVQLVSFVHKNLFYIYTQIWKNQHLFKNNASRELFKEEFFSFKYILREERHPLKFKCFYELYYFQPLIAELVSYFWFKLKK